METWNTMMFIVQAIFKKWGKKDMLQHIYHLATTMIVEAI
jgi:hypothetical protein